MGRSSDQGRGLGNSYWGPELYLERMPRIGADQVAQVCLYAQGAVGTPGSPEHQVWPHLYEVVCFSLRPSYAMVGIGHCRAPVPLCAAGPWSCMESVVWLPRVVIHIHVSHAKAYVAGPGCDHNKPSCPLLQWLDSVAVPSL